MYTTLKIMATAAAVALMQASNDGANATSSDAREFLEKLQSNLNETLLSTTDNAMFGFVDIGFPYATFVKELSGKTLIPKECHLTEVKTISLADGPVILPGTKTFVPKDNVTEFNGRWACEAIDSKKYNFIIVLEYFKMKVASIYLTRE